MKSKKIKLHFIIKAFSTYSEEFKIIRITKSYESNLKLSDIIKELYQQYSQGHFSQDNLGPFGYCALIYEPNLFEIKYKFKGLEPEPQIFDYENISIKDLEAQFSITKNEFEIWFDPHIGGSVGRCRGIHFFFHTDEKDLHHNPHIHCKCAEEELRVDLNSIKIMDKPFKSKKRTDIALEIIKINQQELLKYWNDTVIKGESVKFKMYFPHH